MRKRCERQSSSRVINTERAWALPATSVPISSSRISALTTPGRSPAAVSCSRAITARGSMARMEARLMEVRAPTQRRMSVSPADEGKSGAGAAAWARLAPPPASKATPVSRAASRPALFPRLIFAPRPDTL